MKITTEIDKLAEIVSSDSSDDYSSDDRQVDGLI